MAFTHKRNARNELIYNSGGSVQKTLYSLPSGASRMKFATFCCETTLISKLLPSIYLLLILSNRNLKSHYRPTTQDTSPTMNWPMKASQSQATGPKLAAYTMPNLYMGSLVKSWKGGSTRDYLTICKMHLTGP